MPVQSPLLRQSLLISFPPLSQIVKPVKAVSFTIKRTTAIKKQQLKQEKKELKVQAEKKGLLGIAPEIEESVPHLLQFEDEKIKIEERSYDKKQTFHQVIVPIALSYVAFYYNLLSNVHNGVCLGVVMLINIILGLIARSRANKFKEYFKNMTGYSFEQIEDIGEQQIGIKAVKIMNIVVQQREDETSESYIENWAIYKIKYNLIEVLKNNVRSKELESIIMNRTLKEVKEARKEQYEEIQKVKNRYTISSIISCLWSVMVFIYDHKVILSALLLSGGLIRKIGYINSLKYFIRTIATTVTLTQEVTTTTYNVVNTASSVAANVAGRVMGWFN